MSLENEPVSAFQTWEAVEAAVARCIAESTEPFEPTTLSNVRDLLCAISKHCSVPDGMAKGYWSTIQISWNGIEVEGFGDRYELYRFRDGATDVEYFEHASGADVSSDLVRKLARIVPKCT